MKKQKKNIQEKSVYVVAVGGYNGPQSEHIFKNEFDAIEFYSKVKFVLDLLNDDWSYVLLKKEEDV